MLETSKDILNISIAVAIVVLVIFLCWAIYYLIANLRRINRISKQVERGVIKAEDLIDLLKGKIKQSSSYIFVLGRLAEKAIEHFINRKSKDSPEEREEKEEKRKRRSKKD
jgi:biopolymer transport protein ExbB/TolQ